MHLIFRSALGLGLLLALACGPSDPLEEARSLQRDGRFAETIDPLREILDDDPARTEANLLLGTALFRTGSAGLAVWPLRRATELPDHAVEAGLLLTQAMLESRTAPDALEEIDRVLALEPENLRALELRVEANQATGNIEVSLADIDRVLELDPNNLSVVVPRVIALIRLDRIEEAGQVLGTAQQLFDDAEGDVSSKMLARLCVATGMFAFEQGDRETAEKQYAKCIEQFPVEQLAVVEAVGFYDRIGQTARATEILERALSESGNSLFRSRLARRVGALGKPEDEERLLREEAEERPTPMSWFVLADYYVSREEYVEALDAFERAVASGSATSRLRFAYADTLVRAERFDDARRVSGSLKQPELRNLIRGRILLGEGNIRGALTAFESGIRLWPNNAVGRFLAGQAAERVGDFPRATSHYRESFRTSPSESEAGRALAELYSARGDHVAALRIANRYIKQHARDPAAYLLSIRLAHAGRQPKIVSEGLMRLSQLPGQAAVAVAEEAAMLASSERGEQAVNVVARARLDLSDPANAVALRILVQHAVQHAKTVEFVQQAVAAKPDEAAFQEFQGTVLQAAGETVRARDAFERALALDPENWRVLAGLAALAAEAGERSEALALYDRAIAAGPSDAGPAFAAVALVRDAEPVAAARRLTKLLEAHPRQAGAANDLALLLVDAGELGRARRYAARAAWFALPEAKATLARIEEMRGESPASEDSTPAN
ncbi:MAG: tetratricopeptide repeat protein [Myxococcota bacterium]|nr:tetratricopeptide repeat protein [Myxococcota bacterium]